MLDIGPLSPAPSRLATVTAHRGAPIKGVLPDNSIPAARASVLRGIPFIELDVRLSQDKELFLFHDGSVQSHNSFAPSQLRGRAIQSLRSDERRLVFLNRDHTISIPSLSEALDVIRGSKTSVQLDLKQESDELALAVFDLLSKRGQINQALVQLRSPARADMIKRAYPHARILGRCVDMETLRAFVAINPEFVELERWASSEAIALAHGAGVAVSANVAGSRLDEPSTWNYLRSRGLDSIMSDRAQEHCEVGACLD